MALFSYHNGIPGPLPEALQGASIEQLEALGYKGPFDAPQFNPRTQRAEWNGTWQIIDLSVEEIEAANYKRLLSRADWTGFSNGLMASSAYAKARAAAATSLSVNVDCIELIALMGDAKSGRPYVDGINNCLSSIETSVDLTEEDKKELHNILSATGLSSIVFVPNYSPEDESMQ
jgi:hypothetical protein